MQDEKVSDLFRIEGWRNTKDPEELRNIISIVSFIMAVFSGTVVLFIKNNDKQKMASFVAFLFLISFLINIDGAAHLFLRIACLVTFALALLSGVVSIFGKEEYRRWGAIITGIVSLGVSLLILFMYIEFQFP